MLTVQCSKNFDRKPCVVPSGHKKSNCQLKISNINAHLIFFYIGSNCKIHSWDITCNVCAPRSPYNCTRCKHPDEVHTHTRIHVFVTISVLRCTVCFLRNIFFSFFFFGFRKTINSIRYIIGLRRLNLIFVRSKRSNHNKSQNKME